MKVRPCNKIFICYLPNATLKDYRFAVVQYLLFLDDKNHLLSDNCHRRS